MSDFTPTPERQKQILSLLTQQGRLSVAEIVTQFSISEATARRDLETLASQGKAQRVHGGVIAIEQAPPERQSGRSEQSEEDPDWRVAPARHNETIFRLRLTVPDRRNLRDRQNLTVITNSLPV
jgi:DeoR/GlpR family transcriptional regulator of sugar metabolism